MIARILARIFGRRLSDAEVIERFNKWVST